MFVHFSCVSNTRFQIHHDHRIKLTALRDIPKGTEITIKYMPCSMGNTMRRLKIKKNWHFDCLCERCHDLTELGTNFEAIKCQKCPEDGYLLPKEALNTASEWICNHCSDTVNDTTMRTLLETLQNEADQFKEADITKVEAHVEKWSKILHKHHYLIFMFKKRLMDLYRLLPPPEENTDNFRNYLQKQVDLGQELLKIIAMLEPGYTLKRGRLLRQLHLPTLQLAKMNLKEKKISNAQFVATARASILKMNDAVKCMEDFDMFIVSSGNVHLNFNGNSEHEY